jgi:hypothetical protein
LRREVLQQSNLLVGERPYFLTVDRDISEQDIVLPQCRSKVSARAAQIHERPSGGFPALVCLGSHQVGGMNQILASN